MIYIYTLSVLHSTECTIIFILCYCLHCVSYVFICLKHRSLQYGKNHLQMVLQLTSESRGVRSSNPSLLVLQRVLLHMVLNTLVSL